MIKVTDLHKSFGKLLVLNGVTEHIKKGEAVSIIGPSGSGKSTFLRCLNLLEMPDSGTVEFEGHVLNQKGVDINQYRRRMGMVFQSFNVFPHMSCIDNITMAPVLQKLKTKEEATAQAEELLSAGADVITMGNHFTKSATSIPISFQAGRSSALQ